MTAETNEGAGNGGPVPFLTSQKPLAEAYDTALLDLDGVVYRGADAVPHAAEALRAAQEHGMRRTYVTNNASRTPEAVAEHLNELGVAAAAHEVVTSAQAAARMAVACVGEGGRVLVIGGDGLRAAVRELGLKAVAGADDMPDIVVQGYSPDLGWKDLAEATYAVRRGVPWIATNTDTTVPTARGIAPGNGTLVAAVGAASGKTPQVAGKPELPLHRESILRSGATRPLIVGDRLDTDIEGAVRGNTDSLLVFTGVTTARDLLAAPPDRRPSYLAEDLRGLLTAHVAPTRDGVNFVSARWTAAVVSEQVVLHGHGDKMDALRAMCAAVWEYGREVDVEDALASLA
ncbi:HAD-superfamily hydrolase, subfamily IIA [Catenulispora acidiphila DSM 44928]|uniref:HAD-superfamily hydrolase, subfamily IIA n=1 Tax=Catenulispora acidiphila (strain DSM 44928 / JCM 14897 / NBRC 102108 / NRRL B-24433 / ID139908) TaxID=479433 RepID=C7Q9F2_CATAD|nr:HAD-IIA family hydrolase [Catenulispora acidiphila]ACU74298.1 HAD-superfamily hydrolase, subfamily IIA [Catenulispora acidiphila DSM 44928]